MTVLLFDQPIYVSWTSRVLWYLHILNEHLADAVTKVVLTLMSATRRVRQSVMHRGPWSQTNGW